MLHHPEERDRARRDEIARRVAIQHDIAAVADGILLGDDLHAHLDDHERLARLAEAVGGACADVIRNGTMDIDACLLHVAAEATLWLEARTRAMAL